VITVAKSGGDYQSISAALAGITTASAGSPFVVKVGPGTFQESVVMKPYVDIEGSGTNVTLITATAGNTPDKGTVTGASNAQLRDLTVQSVGPGGGYATAFAVLSAAAASLLDVQVIVLGAGAFNGYGLYARGTGANIDARDVTITGSGAIMTTYGAYAEVAGQIRCRECVVSVPLSANAFALYSAGGSPVLAANSQVIGSTSAAACVGAYDQNFQARTCN
jgi:hypothetical protein